MRVETKGSFWWLDESAHEYMRLPKHEAPRERPEWSDERAGVLQDAVWHPFERWAIGKHPSYRPDGQLVEVPDPRSPDNPPIMVRVLDDPIEGLMIWPPGDDDPLWAPHAAVLGDGE